MEMLFQQRQQTVSPRMTRQKGAGSFRLESKASWIPLTPAGLTSGHSCTPARENLPLPEGVG